LRDVKTVSKGSKWPGLIPLARKLLYGGVKTPKLKRYSSTSTPTTSANYEGMHEHYRWFRQDEMVRRCVVINALFATMAAGFETELEATGDVEKGAKEALVKKYGYVKEYVDAVNKQVNMDQVLFVSQVKRSIYGKAGWEIVLESEHGPPSWLLSLQSTKLKARLGEDWSLQNFAYEGRDGMYAPDEVLYFTNLQLENDREGLSDVEPVRDICLARHHLLREDFAEITRTLWAPYTILQADTSGMTPAHEDAFLTTLMEAARSGKSLAMNKSVEATVVNMEIDFTGLVAQLDKFEDAIMRAFGVPRFLVGKPPVNRATAYAELEAYIQGPITHIQRFFKRQLEAQWYDRWTKHILSKHGVQSMESKPLPVVVKHKWNPIRVVDIYEMARAVALLYGAGQGILTQYPDLAFEMMAWPKEWYLEEEEKAS
jgi:hypothetical protein